MSQINFTANFIKHTNVQKRYYPDSYYNKEASIVELDKNDANDVDTLYKTSVSWTQNGARFASEIFHEAVKGYEYDDVVKEHYYAVTEQNNNYDKLEPDKILGMMLFSESKYNENEINWFQVKPNSNFVNSRDRAYKHVGKALINLLKEKHSDKTIYVKSSAAAVDFYKSQGFENNGMEPSSCLYLNA